MNLRREKEMHMIWKGEERPYFSEPLCEGVTLSLTNIEPWLFIPNPKIPFKAGNFPLFIKRTQPFSPSQSWRVKKLPKQKRRYNKLATLKLFYIKELPYIPTSAMVWQSNNLFKSPSMICLFHPNLWLLKICFGCLKWRAKDWESWRILTNAPAAH